MDQDQIKLIWDFYRIPGKIWANLDISFLLRCSKVIILVQNVIFGQFDDLILIFEDEISQRFGFLDKKVPNFDGLQLLN